MRRAVIIDLKKTEKMIERPEEYLEFFETDGKDMVLPDEITPETRLQTVNMTRKLYRAIKISGLTSRRVRTTETYYVCIEDWEKVVPLLRGMIQVETEDVQRDLRDAQDDLRHYVEKMEKKLYVRVGRFIERLFGRRQ